MESNVAFLVGSVQPYLGITKVCRNSRSALSLKSVYCFDFLHAVQYRKKL